MPSSFPDRDRPVGSVLPVTVRIDRAGPVWTVLIDRPEARNAVDGPTAQALADAFREFDADPTAAVAVLAGAGGTFCAGADLKAMSNRLSSDMTDDGPMGPSRMELGKPVIAAIGGHAVAGGLELAAWCDLRVMEADAVIGVFCRRWGVPLIDGGTVRLPRIVGLGRALDLILTGRPVGAEEALAMGFANRVVPPGRGRAAAEELAAELARFPQACLRSDRRSVYDAFGRDEAAALAVEFGHGADSLAADGVAGAARFRAGAGRHGQFGS
jgi:enoyl-CoA hydratase